MFMQTYAFDGLDIDWEYPSAVDRGGKPADRANLVSFTQELRAAFGTQYGLSVTLPASFYYMQNFDVTAMQEHVDFFNVMAYDLHGVWDNSTTGSGPYINPHTNLTEIDGALDLLWRSKVAPEKVTMGLAWYGRSFVLKDSNCTTPNGVCEFSAAGFPGPCVEGPGTLSLWEIQDIIAAEKLTPVLDTTAAIKYVAYNKTTEWVSYDDEETIRLKQAFASKRCLGGTMVWSMDQANPNSQCGLPEAVRPLPSNSSVPATGYNSTAPADCTKMQVSSNTTVASIIATSGNNFTSAQLQAWNPQIASWNPLTPGATICVSPPGGWYIIAPTPPMGTNASATASASGPTKTQAGIASDCNSYATAAAGDTCIKFAAAHDIETAQLYAWNPVLGADGKDCAKNFWAEENYCIGVSGSGSNATSSNATATAGSSGGSSTASSSGPMLTQAGITPDCTSFATAAAGDTCIGFAAAHGIETAQLYEWNPVLNNGTDCPTKFWAEESYCIAAGSSSGSVASSTGVASSAVPTSVESSSSAMSTTAGSGLTES